MTRNDRPVRGGVDYVALLRGINVGGKSLVRMAELRAQVEELGFADVATYIQSGNVLFRAPRQKRDDLAARLEGELSRWLASEIRVVLLNATQLRKIVAGAPAEFGDDDYLSEVIFIRKPLTVKRALKAIELREGIDRVTPGSGVLYFSRLAARASGSRISRFAMRPEYQDTTIRNWRTTAKLMALVDARSAAAG